MSPETASQKTKVCPTCGTRLSENATRCLVCGTELGSKPEAKVVKKVEKTVQASRMPEITLSLPAALGLLAVVLLIGAGGIYAALNAGGRVIEPTIVVTATETPTPSTTPTETLPPTAIPTATLLPPFDYKVAPGDTSCSLIAFNFGISVQSLIILNNLPSTCNNLQVGQVLKIPYPTPTPLPVATNTLEPAAATIAACESVKMQVQADQTLSGIALIYNVSMADIKEFNGLSTDSVQNGQWLKIPLCRRAGDPNKPTPTATIPPPYPAANLLLPADGAAFTLANDVVTLQWASVGTLRPGEAYQVTIEDVTANQARRLTDFVTDTKYIVPTTFRPKDNVAHVLRWWVASVRQTGTDEQGQPIWVAAGSTSDKHVFTWVGVAVEGTPSP